MELSAEQEKLAVENRRLVYYLVQQFGITQNSPEYEEVVAAGMVGLVKAAIKFDLSKNVKFSTFASKCINNEVLMYYRNAKKHAKDISIYEPIGENKDGKELTIEETIEDSKSNFVEEIVNKDNVRQLISIILNCLEGKSRIVILYRLGNVSQKDIAKMLQFSQSYITRVEAEARRTILKIFNGTLDYNEKFSVDITKEGYRICFPCKVNKEETILDITACPESFLLIAKIIQKMNNLS